ncbi:phosphonate ABC transporter ATP-binding protein [Natronospira bacteriovora]|uniref:Phosphonate ABC transporter ATP-binding protein n=1 Tax=Natronospira bacteriovora TaxID=3069753 RepID=A0ABU0W451_9GAMM|nr:phosphonate ABC transporter ATP-binding protein [Natronospira sp. AB-CW4]MDQ2068797.1 phosphonate ABC transporter ATP-binding protein [Natronospira sp. AB-CW4]
MRDIRVHDISKVFPNGTRSLDKVGFELGAGESAVLLGHNGSGKSTLLRCLNALERPTAGRVEVGGINLTSARGASLRLLRRDIGVVFQRINLVPNLSAFQNVLFGAMGRQRGLLGSLSITASAEDRAFAMHCLERVSMAHLASQRADTLSGGQQQRVAIARTLMQRPSVILADEPIAALDPKAGQRVMELLWSVARDEGMTVICTLHNLSVARTYGERFIALVSGRKVIDAPAAKVSDVDLKALYADADTAEDDGDAPGLSVPLAVNA